MTAAASAVLAMLGARSPKGFADFVKNAPEEVVAKLATELATYNLPKVFAEFDEAMCFQRSLEAAQAGKCAVTTAEEIVPPPRVKGETLETCFDTADAAPAQIVRAKDFSAAQREGLRRVGLDALAAGEVAIVILAGGQGTRLGFDKAKGLFPLEELPSKSTIYGVIMRRILALSLLAKAHGGVSDAAWSSIPTFIMTSEQNDAETREHFEENDYFGLSRGRVHFVKQNVMPTFDRADGSILFEDATTLTRNSNGNGDVFNLIANNQHLMTGVKYLHIHGIDNIIVKSADPLFLGASIKSQAQAANKCCIKVSPEEKVGCQVIKKPAGSAAAYPSVIEYTELTPEQMTARDAHGDLVFSSANIVNHFFRLDSLKAFQMRYHVAYKKVPFFSFEKKERVTNVVTPNGVKLEYFIFDAFESMTKVLVFESDRAEEFSPIKNASGADSPQTAVADLLALHSKFLKNAGLVDGAADRYEIQSLSYEGENLSTFVKL